MTLQEFEKRRIRMSEGAYLAFDRASEIKHEYHDGQRPASVMLV